MSQSVFQIFLTMADTDISLKVEFNATAEALKADKAISDDATINDIYEKFISLAPSRDLKIVKDYFDERHVQAGENHFKEMMTGDVELSDGDMESVSSGKKVEAAAGIIKP